MRLLSLAFQMECTTLSLIAQQIVNLSLGQAQQIRDVEHALADVQARGGLHLDLALRAPRDAEPGGLQHGDVVCAVADRHGLGERDVLGGREAEEQVALVLGVDDRELRVQLARQRL